MFGLQRVADVVDRKAMMQREVQLALNVAKARDTLQWWGTLYTTFITTVTLAKLSGRLSHATSQPTWFSHSSPPSSYRFD